MRKTRALQRNTKESPPVQKQRLIIAANRLPISAQRKPDGSWGLNQSAGGLVSALSGVGNNYEMLWVGWPGVFVEEGPDRDALTQLLLRRGCLPIYLSRSEVDLYYNGYCNNILWPLFHYVPLSFESKLSETKNMVCNFPYIFPYPHVTHYSCLNVSSILRIISKGVFDVSAIHKGFTVVCLPRSERAVCSRYPECLSSR